MLFFREVVSCAMFTAEDFNFCELQKAVLMDQARSTTHVEVEANNDVPIAVLVWIKDATTQKKLQRVARIAISADGGEADSAFNILSLFEYLNNDVRSIMEAFHDQVKINCEKDDALIKMTKNLNTYREIKERDDKETIGGFGVYVETLALSHAKLQEALDRKTKENIELKNPLPPVRGGGSGGPDALHVSSYHHEEGGADSHLGGSYTHTLSRNKRARPPVTLISPKRNKSQRDNGDKEEVITAQATTRRAASLLNDSDDSN